MVTKYKNGKGNHKSKIIIAFPFIISDIRAQKGSCGKKPTNIGETQRHLAARFSGIFQEIQPFLNIYLPATHVIISPFKILIFCHMVAKILTIK